MTDDNAKDGTSAALERGLQAAFLLLTRKRYDEAEAALAELDAAYPNNAEIAALRERTATAEREARAEIDRGHWNTIFRVPSQALQIVGLVLFLSGGISVFHAMPEFRRAGWEGVISWRGRNGNVTLYPMRAWMYYSGITVGAGVASLGFAAYARAAWEE